MQHVTKISIFFVVYLTLHSFCYGQGKIKIEHADELSGGRKDGEFNRFSGNVIFSRGDTRIFCDEAIYYKSREFIEATGHVHIVEGDSIDITGEKLTYDGNTRVAKLRKNVVFTKKGIMTLYTNNLDYDREKQTAFYFNNGRLVDSTNTLNSRKGYYNVETNIASFKGRVVGENENFTLKTDTLQYNSVTKVIFFRDKTVLTDTEGNKIEYEEGSYDSNAEVSNLEKNIVYSDTYIITADFFNLEDKKQIYRANKNVELVDTKNDIIVDGQSAIYWKKTGVTKIFNNPILKVLMDKDTLYLTADTLVAIDSKIEANKKLFAYRNVRIFKKDLQGKADSVVYHVSDSMINFYFKPVLWVEENQISADSITAYLANRQIDRMELVSNSFVVSSDTLKNFNQIKGRETVAFFTDNKLSRVEVTGNGESIFYALTDDESDIIGVNKSQSSTITILFENNRARKVKFYSSVDSSLIPPHELKAADQTLKGFIWRLNERPTLNQVLHKILPEKVEEVPQKEQ